MNRWVILMLTTLVVVLVIKFPHQMINPGALVEGHANIESECTSCHQPFWGIPNTKCISCHALDEIGLQADGSFDSVMRFHVALADQSCVSCHDDHKGRVPLFPLSRFEHNMLTGAMLSDCAQCHATPRDDLHAQVVNTCNSCHNTEVWESIAAFDHNMIKPENRNTCYTCHQAPSDALHVQLTRSDCASCHTNMAWKPATFVHDDYFVLDRDHNVSCNTCHTSGNYSKYSCYGCHEHREQKMIAEHAEEGIYNIAQCADCHKDADEDHAIRSIGDKQWNNAQPKGNRERNGKKHDEEGEEDDQP